MPRDTPRRDRRTNVLLKNLWVPDDPVPCGADPEMWADAGGSGTYRPDEDYHQRETKSELLAMEICQTVCPLQQECLTAAMREEGGKPTSSRFGIRGGLMPYQRSALARKTRRMQ